MGNDITNTTGNNILVSKEGTFNANKMNRKSKAFRSYELNCESSGRTTYSYV